jgi:hypothetical protein
VDSEGEMLLYPKDNGNPISHSLFWNMNEIEVFGELVVVEVQPDPLR